MSASTVQEDDENSKASDVEEKGDDTSSDFDSSRASSMTYKDGNPSGDKGDLICLRRSKLIVLALVAIVAAVTGAATFVYTSRNQDDEFESRVGHVSLGHSRHDTGCIITNLYFPSSCSYRRWIHLPMKLQKPAKFGLRIYLP